MLDCGYTVYPRLRQKGLADAMDYFLITHLHDDHVGSLCSAILHQHYMRQPSAQSRIIYPTVAFRDELAEFLRQGMQAPDVHIDWVPIAEIEGLHAIDTTGYHIEGMTTFGFIFETDEDLLAYSGDLGKPEIIMQKVQELRQNKRVQVFHEMAFFETPGVHTYYKDLMQWEKEFPIYAYHLDPRREPDDNTIPLVVYTPEFLM